MWLFYSSITGNFTNAIIIRESEWYYQFNIGGSREIKLSSKDFKGDVWHNLGIFKGGDSKAEPNCQEEETMN